MINTKLKLTFGAFQHVCSELRLPRLFCLVILHPHSHFNHIHFLSLLAHTHSHAQKSFLVWAGVCLWGHVKGLGWKVEEVRGFRERSTHAFLFSVRVQLVVHRLDHTASANTQTAHAPLLREENNSWHHVNTLCSFFSNAYWLRL